jgi:anti-sigma-K factor RskA
MSDIAGGRHPDDDLAVYAVGGLEARQHDAVDAHLARCAQCRAQVDTYLETLAALISDEDPPPHLWNRIAAEIASEPRAARSHTPEPPVARPRHLQLARPRRRWAARGAAAFAAAALVITVVAVGVARLRPDARPDSAGELAHAALDDPDSTVVALTNPDDNRPAARLVIDASGDAYILFDDLDRLPDDQTYQLWRTESTTPVSLAVLGTGASEAVEVSLPAGPARLAISREPVGGSPAPTGPLVAAGTRS